MYYEKKYKDALERAKIELNADTTQGTKNVLMTVFPELKESDDERIRKGIIDFLWKEKIFLQEAHSSVENNPKYRFVMDAIAWLEKQKAMDKDIIFRPLAGTDIIVAAKQALEKIEIGKEVVLAFNGAYIHVNGKTVAEICNEYFSWLEKQGEQKVPINDFKAKNWYVSEVDGKIHDMTYNPADKVEPKFKVGDWVVKGDTIAQILDIQEQYYVGLDINGKDFTSSRFLNDDKIHLWTLDDAKDGDVLACGDKVTDCPFIFHNLTKELNPRSYCGVNTLCHFQDNDENGGFWCKSDEVRPATKEQRELLFKKMKEAGYQWNPDTKELKKVEQKPVNDTVETIVETVSNTSILDMIEDKDAFTNPGVFENSLGRLLKLFEKLPKQDLLDGLRFYANVVKHDGEYVKPTEWSEDDEEMIDKIIDYMKPMPIFFESTKGKSGKEYTKEFIKNAIKWLKSIKGRIQPQQKWTEEDENGFGETLWAINKARTIAENENDMGNLWYAENWLKSLKERLS